MPKKIKVKTKAQVVGISLSAILAWGGNEIYVLKQEATAHKVEIEALKDKVEDHRQSQQELIKLHLVIR